MKKIIKNPIFTFILGILICGSTAVAASTMLARNITYTPNDNTWDVNNVEAALDSLYQNKSNVVLYDKKQYTGDVINTYTFGEKINLGIVVISSDNNINDGSYYVANINSLSSGTFEVLDDSYAMIGGNQGSSGHRSKIYVIKDVDAGAVMQYRTRYAGIVQILKIN